MSAPLTGSNYLNTAKNSFFVDALSVTPSDTLKKSETTCAYESISQKVNFAYLGL